MPDMPHSPITLDLKASLKRPFKRAAGVGIAAAVITLFMPNYYKSDACLLPVEAKGTGGLGNLSAAAAAFGVALPGGEGSDANFTDILQSRWMKENLLQTEFTFHARSWRFGTDTLRHETLYAYLDARNMDRAVKAMDKVLSASRDLKSKVITISAETKSPELSQEIVQRATALLNEFVLEKSQTRGSEKAAFAEARLADARKAMDKAEATLLAFLEANRNYQVSADPAVRLRGARLEADLNLRRQLVTTLAINREQALLDAKNDVPILNLLDKANLPIDKSKPHRSIIVLLIVLLSGMGAWGWDNRAWIRERLLEDDSEPVNPTSME